MKRIPLFNHMLFTLLLLVVSSSAYTKEWAFDVYLDKTKIGEHTFKLSEDKTLTSQAKFNVKVLFINAYQYDHQAIESWDKNCIKSLEADTLENKIKTVVKGQRNADYFEVNNGKETKSLPFCTMTFAYWNQKILEQSKLLNPQNAEFLDVSFKKFGKAILDVKGKATETLHYKLNGSLDGKPKLNIELWYTTDQQEWVGLKSVTPEGYNIYYQLK
jgi:hypothetical protein